MRVLNFTIAAALGAGCYLGYHHLFGERDGKPAGGAASASTNAVSDPAALPRDLLARDILAPGPILSADFPESPPPAPTPPREEGDSAGERAAKTSESSAGGPAPGGGAAGGDPSRPEAGAPARSDQLAGNSRVPAAEEPSVSPPPEVRPRLPAETARQEFRSPAEPVREPLRAAPGEPVDLEGMAGRARIAFEAGDIARGANLLREVFRAGRDRPEVDLVSVTRKLVEVEDRGNNERAPLAPSPPGSERRDLYRYLVDRDSDPAWRYRATLGLGTLEAQEVTPEQVRSAWQHLTMAYLAATGQPQRRQVITVLEPFLKKHIFSKRYSPLMATHTVKQGDSLHKIAKSHGSTEEAVQRLNQINGNVIHPGQRLIVLEGKPRIFVKKTEFRLWLMLGERLLLEAPVGLGRDSSTPAAVFQIAVRQKDPIWYRRGEPPIPAGDPRNILGTRWLGFKDTEELSGFGLHGTTDPASIGKEESSGCIRLHSRDLEILWDFVPLGTEVEVME